MNEANVSIDRIASSEVISQHRSELQLRRIEGTVFAVTEPTLEEPSYVFESPGLRRYIDRYHPSICSVALIHQREVAGKSENNQMRLELGLSDGNLLILNEKDQVFEATPMTDKTNHSILQSPVQVWGLPAQLPYASMLLTKRLVETLDSLAADGQHAYLLNVLWKEYELAHGEAEQAEQTHRINGDFMRFSARPFQRFLVLFDRA